MEAFGQPQAGEAQVVLGLSEPALGFGAILVVDHSSMPSSSAEATMPCGSRESRANSAGV
jgi:hypothetical protein